jgi:methylenetetrahydrofolate reductase (NADPH)
MALAQYRKTSACGEGDAGVRAAIRAFAETASFEMAVGDFKSLEAAAPWLPAGKLVSITWLPKDNSEARIATARALTDAGLIAIPHIAARRISGSAELDRLLARLANEAGVRRAFLIAGDLPRAQGEFGSSLQLLQTGLFERRGFQRIGVAGYPEGHPQIDAQTLRTELRLKLATIRRAGMDCEIVTQFCFEAPPISRWLGALRSHFPHLPVRIGLAGPANFRTLMRFARICGLGPSARAIVKRGSSIARLLTEIGPDPIVRDLMSDPGQREPQTMLHLFPFGGLDRTARWAASVARGDLSLPASNRDSRP